MARLAIISTMGGSPWGGSEYLWAATAEEALLQGHEVCISIYDWSIGHPIIEKLRALGACILPRPKASTPPTLMRRIRNRFLKIVTKQTILLKSPYQDIFDYNPDLILISQGGSYDIAHHIDLYQLLISTNIPFSLICQCASEAYFLDSLQRSRVIEFFKQTNFVAFVSKRNQELVKHQLASPISNSIVVKNPVNLRDHTLIPFPKSSIVSFACMARLDSLHKGQDILFQSLSSGEWRERNWECRLYGDGPDHDYLKSLARYYKISDRIKFMGHNNDIRSIWKDNHILVLASRMEGTPLSLIEAMLCGRPAVVTDIGGNTEWLEEEKSGFISASPTVKDFNQALNKAWIHQDQWEQMALYAHSYAENNIDKNPGKTILNLLLNSIDT